jgi:hypothetical protein
VIDSKDIDEAEHRAEANGTSRYEELEEMGYSTDAIREQFLDMYTQDEDLDAFLSERDQSCTNEELGRNEKGEPEDA